MRCLWGPGPSAPAAPPPASYGALPPRKVTAGHTLSELCAHGLGPYLLLQLLLLSPCALVDGLPLAGVGPHQLLMADLQEFEGLLRLAPKTRSDVAAFYSPKSLEASNPSFGLRMSVLVGVEEQSLSVQLSLQSLHHRIRRIHGSATCRCRHIEEGPHLVQVDPDTESLTETSQSLLLFRMPALLLCDQATDPCAPRTTAER